jgi:hypothetical protein
MRELTRSVLQAPAMARSLFSAATRMTRFPRFKDSAIQVEWCRNDFKIARDYLGRGLALEDLIGEGNLGLMSVAIIPWLNLRLMEAWVGARYLKLQSTLRTGA